MDKGSKSDEESDDEHMPPPKLPPRGGGAGHKIGMASSCANDQEGLTDTDESCQEPEPKRRRLKKGDPRDLQEDGHSLPSMPSMPPSPSMPIRGGKWILHQK